VRLSDVSGQILELEVIGYEFPDDMAHAAARERAAREAPPKELRPYLV